MAKKAKTTTTAAAEADASKHAPKDEPKVSEQAPNALAAMFAQSSVLFAKKASYVQVDAPATTKVDVKAIRAAAAAEVAAGGSSKRKRAAAKAEAATAAAAAADDANEAPREEEEADDEEEEVEKPAKKQKKKKHKKLAQEAAEAAAAAGEDAAPALEQPSPEAAASADKSKRTVFVGNVSLDATQKELKAFFAQCGKVESVRLRFLPLAGCAVDQAGNQKLMMKVCANKKLLTDAKDNCNAYVTFADAASVAAALALNGATFQHRSIRVDHETPVVDPKRSVFVGNVGFTVPDEKVRRFFEKRLKSDEEPQPVVNVRIIRDRATGLGKGFGYVLLRSAALAGQALALHESKLEGRELRVQVCGKRFKNKKGDEGASSKKQHEGVRASAGAQARLAAKRKAAGGNAAPEKAAAGKKKVTPAAAAKKVAKPKHEARKALQAKSGAKVFKKAPAGAKGKKSERTPKPKVKKPKHAARKARQAAEAAAAAAK